MNAEGVKHNIGDIVYLMTDVDQYERLVTGINIRQSGIVYELSCGTQTSWHYDLEIAKDKDILKSLES